MTWTRHHAEAGESCLRHRSHDDQVGHCIRAILQDWCSNIYQGSRGEIYGTVLSWGMGCMVFPLCLGILQVGVFKPLSLTASHVCAPGLGLCSVAVSGILASVTVLGSYSKFHHGKMNEITLDVSLADIACYGLGSAALFKLFKGHFYQVLPSTVLQPGAFARQGIPASKHYASFGKKAQLAAIGSQYGCHTCGKRWTTKMFIADHQPPLALSKRRGKLQAMVKILRPKQPEYKFYPQCISCSRIQQGYLSARAVQQIGDLAPGKRVKVVNNHIVTHATSLRLYHLYLPLPVLISTAFHICAG
ncbi:uncharacterized protein [Diadema antillarum]|uniref:uncharacterized protein n=1 Tax=Diadema antillarum TaxID=105358 RepID=UPI003A850776